jgi:hypothetical protein
LPGFCQFVTGIILFVGLTWFQVFAKTAPFYMAALAFTAYGIHWFAIGWNRYQRNDPRTNAGMCVAFMVISAMGANVFFAAGDWPVGLLFLGLFAVYFFDFFAAIGAQARRAGAGLLPPGNRRLAHVSRLRDRRGLRYRISLAGLARIRGYSVLSWISDHRAR